MEDLIVHPLDHVVSSPSIGPIRSPSYQQDWMDLGERGHDNNSIIITKELQLRIYDSTGRMSKLKFEHATEPKN